MTKSDLVTAFAEKRNIPVVHSEDLVNRFFEAVAEAFKRGDKVEIRGFGSFHVREYDGYEGRNPKTGERVAVEPKKMAFFRVGKELKRRINRNESRS